MSRRRNKLPTEPVEAVIEALSHEGRGVTSIEGKKVFVDGALPGEKVLFKYTRKRSRHAEGYAVEVLEPSDKRIEPKCTYYGLCGGCSFQHLSAADQIEHKQTVLLEQIRHAGGVEPQEVLEPLTGPEWGYRRKARLGVKYVLKKEKLLVGFREKRSSFVAEMNSCEVLHPQVGKRIDALKSLILGLQAYNKIPQIEVAIAQDSTALIFRHLEELSQDDRDSLLVFQNETGLSIFLQSGGPDTVVPLDTSTNNMMHYRLDKYDIDIQFRPDDFTQVNFDINEKMIDRVIEMLDLQSDERVLDLFCGLGNFSLPLANRTGYVLAVEGSNDLILRARENAISNGIENIEFHVLDLMQDDITAPYLKTDCQKILLDPPRTGAQEIIRQLDFKNVEKVVYVSCNPATLARDTGILVKEKGLKLKQAGVMDMFPHTSHVESIALFVHE